ncbi:MAG TPA: extensin family protein [Kofleriaceae bacterium]|jgi:hypothetical protein
MQRGFALLLLAVILPVTAEAKPKTAKRRHARRLVSQKHISHPDAANDTPAYRYGNMSGDECKAELTKREIPFVVEEAKGVAVPVRITGPMHGVTFRTNQNTAQRETTPWEITDCQLALSLDDFAAQLAARDIVEVRHYSIYRPPHGAWPDDKIGIQHIGGNAIDAAIFVKADGTKLNVLDDFYGRIGDKTCGEGAAPRKKTDASTEIRSILCDAVDAHLFNIVLTPNFNRPHRNHFHLEVTGASWFMVH